MSSSKIFIIGLPRTATTSVCSAMLNLGYTTAHTAYINHCFEHAQALADTPIFCDFMALDKAYPNAKFIYLTRALDLWIPSVRQLLQRMYKNLTRLDGGFNIHIKRSFLTVFPDLTSTRLLDDDYLANCYQNHLSAVQDYFNNRQEAILYMDVAHPDSFSRLCQFLDKPIPANIKQFQTINAGSKVTAWNDIKHPLKIDSTKNGRIDKALHYLNQ